ncbi:alpha/beta hydrolase [Listeria ilorinensis]|uniref:alpha/beta hydrolase n=1 Tax=Listeria ilorinensis TaxID=2867439 RepID=UPI001EF3F716|nr:alpha/beta hydrolase [Listeria ilorinensis]
MRKKIIFSVLTVITSAILLIGWIFSYYEQQKQAKAKENILPTMFVHGYKGTANSFGHMLDRLGEQFDVNQAAMQIYVGKHGDLNIRGTLNPTMPGDSAIQVVFEDNRASLARQTVWLQDVMKYLREYEHIKSVNLVGHSMGGLAILSYLENTEQDANYPVPQKFIAIASPFRGIDQADYFQLQKDPAAHDLKSGSDALHALVKNKNKLPNNLQVLAIAGQKTRTDSDGLVDVDSVFFLKEFFPKGNYQEKLITGPDVTHSGLHENTEVDYYVSQFLWDLQDEDSSDALNVNMVPEIE